VNQKGLTYFFFLVFMLSAGTAFSKSVNNMKSVGCSGISVNKAAEMGIVNLSAFGQNGITDLIQNFENNQGAFTGKLSTHLLKNYILSDLFLSFEENTRRTSIRFTSRLKN
jgi:hypothetical protein